MALKNAAQPPLARVAGPRLVRAMRRLVKPSRLLFLTPALCLWLAASGQAPTNYQRIKSFREPEASGATPLSTLLVASDGVLYGTTYQGGTNNVGTVFKVNPDGSGYAILRVFTRNGTDGYNPRAALAQGTDGALYGTASGGGAFG